MRLFDPLVKYLVAGAALLHTPVARGLSLSGESLSVSGYFYIVR
jgi:hypothetical protein